MILLLPFLVSCGDNNSTQNQISQADVEKSIKAISKSHEGIKEKFKNIYSQLSTLNSELPKINTQTQSSVKKLADNCSKTLNEVKADLDKQFQQMNDEINKLGNAMASKGY